MRDDSAFDRIRRIASEKCIPRRDAIPFNMDEANCRLKDLPGWSLQSDSMEKEFRFKSYLSGLEFVYAVGEIGELEDHHPDMMTGWRRVKVSLSKHAIKGLCANDFIMAEKAGLEYEKIASY
jgi:4a-hydroxytetrahydrobiopterin dehydratase